MLTPTTDFEPIIGTHYDTPSAALHWQDSVLIVCCDINSAGNKLHGIECFNLTRGQWSKSGAMVKPERVARHNVS